MLADFSQAHELSVRAGSLQESSIGGNGESEKEGDDGFHF